MKNIPWVEKYRPQEFDKIVLDKYNKQILENIVNKKLIINNIINPLKYVNNDNIFIYKNI